MRIVAGTLQNPKRTVRMEQEKITFEQCVGRVKSINDKLKANGHDWEAIEQFWAMVFKEANLKPTTSHLIPKK